MRNSILLFFLLIVTYSYAQKSENMDSTKQKSNGLFISVDGFLGKSSSNFEPNWSGLFSFQSGVLVGYRIKYLKFGVGLSYQQYSRFQELSLTDFLGNTTYDDGLTVSSNFIVPTFQVSSNILPNKKFYPFISLNYQLPIIISKKWKTTKDIEMFPFSQNRADLKDDPLALSFNHNIKINSGIGFRLNKIVALEASFSYCHIFNGIDFKNTINEKNPYILGGQISAVFNFSKKEN